MNIKIDYKNKTTEYEVWQHPESKACFVDMTEETRIPIEIVKEALEKKFNIKISKYHETGHRAYARDNYKESNQFSYCFNL